MEALFLAGGDQSKAARMIGVHRNTMSRFVDTLPVSPEKMRQEIRNKRYEETRQVQEHKD